MMPTLEPRPCLAGAGPCFAASRSVGDANYGYFPGRVFGKLADEGSPITGLRGVRALHGG